MNSVIILVQQFLVSVLWLMNYAHWVQSLNTYTIGALFHEDSSETETAFKCAVAYFNRFSNDILFRTNIQYVPKDNPFAAYKKVCAMLKEERSGVAAILGPPSQEAAGVINSLMVTLQLPHVQLHPPMTLYPYNSSDLMSINVYPNVHHLQYGMAKIVENFQWKTYAILYENNESIIKLQYVIKASELKKESVILRKLKPPDYRPLLKEVKDLGYSHIIIDCDVKCTLDILAQAKELDMLRYVNNYFVTSLDFHTIDINYLDSLANITSVRITDSEDKRVYRFLRECDIGRIRYDSTTGGPNAFVQTEPSLMWDATNFFTSTFHELFLTGEPEIASINCETKRTGSHSFRQANYMKLRPFLNAITGEIRFIDNERSYLSLQAVETIKGQVRKLANWNSSFPNQVDFVRTEKEQQDLVDLFIQNTTFLVSSRIGQPYLMYRKPSNPDEVLEGNDVFEGYSLDVIDCISKIANFSYKFFITENNELGSYNKEKKAWNGLIRDILNKKAQLAICDLTITEERRSAVDFSLPFMQLGISILYSKPTPEERDIFAFMNPLDPVLWLYISAAYVSITFVMYLLTRFSPADWENPNPSDPSPEELENIWDLKNSFWLILGSTMSQGCDLLPKGISSRMGISMWWLLILIISNSYIANLSAFLTTSRMGPSIESAESLAKQTKIKYGAISGGSTEAFFKNSNFSTYQKMGAQMMQAKPTVNVKDNAEGVKRVKTTKNQMYAFLMESSSIEYVISRDCDLKQVGGRLDYKGYGIAMPVNAPYRSKINNAILKMQEDGTLRKLKEKWWQEMYGGGRCQHESDSSSSDMKLALGNIGGVFVVIFFGLGFACLLAIAEFLWNVYTVSVEEHKPYKDILIGELIFFVSVWHTKKRTYIAES